MRLNERKKLRSLAFWESLQARYPLGSRWELVRPATSVIAANLLTGRALLSGAMRPWELVLLVALEAAAFSAIAWVQTIGLPPDALPDEEGPKQTLAQRLGVLAFGLFWIAAVYGLIFGFYLRELPDWSTLAAAPLAYLGASAIRWPLAVSVGGALLDAIADRQFWRHRGGIFVSTPGFTALARWLTLIFGGIPFFVPFAVGAGCIAAIVKAVERRFKATPTTTWPIALFPLLTLLLFWGMSHLIAAGVVGWTIGYVAAKLGSELLVLGVPLMAERAGQEEREKLAGSVPAGPTKRRKRT